MGSPFDVVVVANRHRKALVLDYLKQIPHKVSYTPDYPLPGGFRIGDTGQYRAFRGHQDALKLAGDGDTLVFEDDAVPKRDDWMTIILRGLPLLRDFEVVSMHSRNLETIPMTEVLGEAGEPFITCKAPGVEVRAYGSTMAYLITDEAKRRFRSLIFDGYPVDLVVPNRFKFCAIKTSPFNHDRSQGSLIDLWAEAERKAHQ